MRRSLKTLVTVALGLTMALARPAGACRTMEFDFTPTEDLQIVVWLEDSSGTFVDTLFVTRTTGTYGLGNRPGLMTFNSELLWPYGRRESVFPVWAHRHGVTYPKLVFQDGNDSDLSHAIAQSSPESHYCRPLQMGEPTWSKSVDAGTCATTPYTDKGRFGPDLSLYPPRADVVFDSDIDSPDAAMFKTLNDLDAVSRATPAGGVPYTLRFLVPESLPTGDYVAYIEVSKEFDQNGFYAFPSPTGIPWSQYGEAYRGQPSVVWSVPIRLDTTPHTAVKLDYDGYGDPDGLTGTITPDDGTITKTMEGSGAGRLLAASSPDGMYRFRVHSQGLDDTIPPDPASDLVLAAVTADSATLHFTAPADTGTAVTAYDVRYRQGAPLTAANFTTDGTVTAEGMTVGAPGDAQTFTLTHLVPNTEYWVGVTALDQCLNQSVVQIVSFTTPLPPQREVDACFVATAAWGSPLAADVSALRRFRDQALRSQAAGELFVEAYYTFGPAFAATIEPSDTLRALSRAGIAPLVALAKTVVGK